MKLRLLLMCMLISFSAIKVNAKGVIIYSTGETVEKVMDLPQREEFMLQTEDGRLIHANLGIMHDQFSIFWVPLWNYGAEKYVLYNDTKQGKYDYTYADLTKDEVAYLQSEFGGIPTIPELSFWTVYGGKILAALILGCILFFKYRD
jgi:hypothetical protein